MENKFTYKDVIDYWRNLNIKTDDELRNALDSFSVLFAYHSGVIENDKITYHDTREIFENGKIINFTGDLKTLYEISNQKDCYEYIVDKIIHKEPLSEGLIKKIHKILTKGTYDERRYVTNNERPGEYKKHDYITGINEVGATPSEVQGLVQDVVNQINEIDTEEAEKVLLMSAFAHNRIENIHPFADGNGRVGRTIMNYILMIHNLPPIIIYDEDKKYYYEALEKFDRDEDLNPTVEFLKYGMEKTWMKKLDKTNHSSSSSQTLKHYL